jgi:hypothetical protein
MHLIQILLPLYDNEGSRFPGDDFRVVRDELADEFGGVTVYSRAPAQGLWKEDSSRVQHDDVILFEVMVDQLVRPWWSIYRETLERRFRQEVIVVRAQEMTML